MRVLACKAVFDAGSEASMVGGVCVTTLPWRSWRKLRRRITLGRLGRSVCKVGGRRGGRSLVGLGAACSGT